MTGFRNIKKIYNRKTCSKTIKIFKIKINCPTKALIHSYTYTFMGDIELAESIDVIRQSCKHSWPPT